MALSLGFLFCYIDLYICLCANTILSWWPTVILIGCFIGGLYCNTNYFNKKKALQTLQVKQKLFSKMFSFYNDSLPLWKHLILLHNNLNDLHLYFTSFLQLWCGWFENRYHVWMIIEWSSSLNVVRNCKCWMLPYQSEILVHATKCGVFFLLGFMGTKKDHQQNLEKECILSVFLVQVPNWNF